MNSKTKKSKNSYYFAISLLAVLVMFGGYILSHTTTDDSSMARKAYAVCDERTTTCTGETCNVDQHQKGRC